MHAKHTHDLFWRALLLEVLQMQFLHKLNLGMSAPVLVELVCFSKMKRSVLFMLDTKPLEVFTVPFVSQCSILDNPSTPAVENRGFVLFSGCF